jgi:hypothetical protein
VITEEDSGEKRCAMGPKYLLKSPARGMANRWPLTSVVVLTVALVPTACAGEEATTTTQTVTTTPEAAPPTTESVVPLTSTETTTAELDPMSAAQISQRAADAAAFGDGTYEPWPDADAVCATMDAQWADDAVYYDPSNDTFNLHGKESIMTAARGFRAANPDLSPSVTGMYVSADTAAYRISGEEHGLQLYRFKDGLVTNEDLWWPPATLETWECGCFAPDGAGLEELQAIAERYLAAWSSGDPDQIAALYQEDATFSDTLLGLRAQGATVISELGEERFWSSSPVSFEILGVDAQTNGPYPAYEQQPDWGTIIGVGIHYRCALGGAGEAKAFEGLTTLELGTRMGSTFTCDPTGLIVREEVLYDADTLLASGLVL